MLIHKRLAIFGERIPEYMYPCPALALTRFRLVEEEAEEEQEELRLDSGCLMDPVPLVLAACG